LENGYYKKKTKSRLPTKGKMLRVKVIKKPSLKGREKLEHRSQESNKRRGK